MIRISEKELEELTARWHAGEWPHETLELVIRTATGWNFWQFARWVAHGKPD